MKKDMVIAVKSTAITDVQAVGASDKDLVTNNLPKLARLWYSL